MFSTEDILSILPEAKIKELIKHLDGWKWDGKKIYREITYPSFLDVINSVTRIAVIAESKDHHPDMDIRYNILRLILWTHDQGGVTAKDMAMARILDQEIKRQMGE